MSAEVRTAIINLLKAMELLSRQAKAMEGVSRQLKALLEAHVATN